MIENCLMSMSSNEKEMHDTLSAFIQKGDPNSEVATPFQWAKYPLYCNLKNHFQVASTHISDVETEYYNGRVDYNRLDF